MNRGKFLAGAVALAFLGKAPTGWATPQVSRATTTLIGTTNLDNINAILRDYYVGPVVAQLNNDVLLMSRLDSI